MQSKQLVDEYGKDLKEFVDVVQTDTSKQKVEVEKKLGEYKEKVGKSMDSSKIVDSFNSTLTGLIASNQSPSSSQLHAQNQGQGVGSQ
jgi:hypothetical protein